MHNIIIENECGCFRKSGIENNQSIESKDEALMKSIEIVNVMNSDFCGKHNFKLIEAQNNFVIAFNQSTSHGCCGGGCGSHSH